LDADQLTGKSKDELTTKEGYRLIDQIAEVNPEAMLILTGGEPLLREDIFELSRYASSKNLMVVLGSNGTLIDEQKADALLTSGIQGVGISLDSTKAEIHDSFRGVKGAWQKTMRGIEICREKKIDFQIQTTVTQNNYNEISELLQVSAQSGARGFHLFFLVCTGRGQKLSDISPLQCEEMLSYLLEIQDQYKTMLIRARCAPHFLRIAHQNNSQSPLVKGYSAGCWAGTHYCRVTPEGQVTPCPYLPLSVGNLRETNFIDIWESSPVFRQLRNPGLKGKCGICEFTALCGGCRANAYASYSDYLAEDPWCLYYPKKNERTPSFSRTYPDSFPKSISEKLIWAEDAEQRLKRVPYFVRSFVKERIEAHAREKGYTEINLALMKNVRKGQMNFFSKDGPKDNSWRKK
jgi:radical SAM protein with 4Fe4S-binding SPASM domain